MFNIKEKIIQKTFEFTSNLHKISNQEFKELNIGEGQHVVLKKIYENRGISINEVANKLNRDKTTISKTIKKLIAKKLVYSNADKSDGRVIRLYINDRKIESVELIQKKFKKIDSKVFKGIKTSEQKIFLEILNKIISNIK